jgi:hypothetical protein
MQKDKENELFKELENNGYSVYKKSIRRSNDSIFLLLSRENIKYLGIFNGDDFNDESILRTSLMKRVSLKSAAGGSKFLRIFSADNNSIDFIANVFPDISPQPLGLSTTFGFGDRLGLATPGHIRSIEKFRKISPVFAQQSVRELEKTGRSFKDMINSAVLGVFQEGYRAKWGADADHIKRKEDIINAIESGCTMFTLDTTELLNESPDRDFKIKTSELVFKNFSAEDIIREYRGQRKLIKGQKDIPDYSLSFDEENISYILFVYGCAIDFIFEIYELLKSKTVSFDYEISFDETSTVTTPEAHYLVANLMKDTGIDFSSLALRFPGVFEKGIDFLGSIKEFGESVYFHNQIAKEIDGYKISLHSGSDKFSIYPLFSEFTESRFHIKTSGTSWLECLRVVAKIDKKLFRRIYEVAVNTFDENNRAYHLSLKANELPLALDETEDEKLEELIYIKEIRQALHISYGSVLEVYKNEISRILGNYEELHFKFLEDYLKKHLEYLNQ